MLTGSHPRGFLLASRKIRPERTFSLYGKEDRSLLQRCYTNIDLMNAPDRQTNTKIVVVDASASPNCVWKAGNRQLFATTRTVRSSFRASAARLRHEVPQARCACCWHSTTLATLVLAKRYAAKVQI
jgi:hypothetical protein